MTSRTSLLLSGISLFLVIETWFTIFHDCWLVSNRPAVSFRNRLIITVAEGFE